MLNQGRLTILGLDMQSRGSALVQGWSPSKGLQLLQEKRPAQLFSYAGQTVAWSVSPLLRGCSVLGEAETADEGVPL